ncbi:ArsR/SmtB family transcription factor [Ruania alba]|uniref:Helix-turn-helix domain-containing protein n=1 Tax=Ruania alba TaxID=648782 RepID=A0A1H5HTJ3_9MICO|nr:metalloregulator ArsR/SmtB family transcription factor [Ruania alba]SEE31396.1 Helix-turn-helix domain-containing protein [Ruania alba]
MSRSSETAGTAPGELVAVCAALADETRWQILAALGTREASASGLARELPVTRQAIARHLSVLEAVGLVEATSEGAGRTGRAVEYRALGAPLSRLAEQLETIGRGWDRRLAQIKKVAES